MKAQEALDTLAQQISVCTKCDLYKGRTHAVPGEGPTHAEIMLIGEGPGANEDKQGRPFVGASGKFLDQLLAQAGVTRAGCVDHQCGQVPSTGQPRPAAD